jgi:hypothetical protein
MTMWHKKPESFSVVHRKQLELSEKIDLFGKCTTATSQVGESIEEEESMSVIQTSSCKIVELIMRFQRLICVQ